MSAIVFTQTSILNFVYYLDSVRRCILKSYHCLFNKLAKLGDAIAISNLKLSMTDSLTHSPTALTDQGRCQEMLKTDNPSIEVIFHINLAGYLELDKRNFQSSIKQVLPVRSIRCNIIKVLY